MILTLIAPANVRIVNAQEDDVAPAEYVTHYDELDAARLASVTKNEYNGMASQTHLAAVMWTVLNRVDSPAYPNTVEGVLTAPNQFAYWGIHQNIDPGLLILAQDVLARWNTERNGSTEQVGRVLPPDYVNFHGDGKFNHFKNPAGTEYVLDTAGYPYYN